MPDFSGLFAALPLKGSSPSSFSEPNVVLPCSSYDCTTALLAAYSQDPLSEVDAPSYYSVILY